MRSSGVPSSNELFIVEKQLQRALLQTLFQNMTGCFVLSYVFGHYSIFNIVWVSSEDFQRLGLLMTGSLNPNWGHMKYINSANGDSLSWHCTLYTRASPSYLVYTKLPVINVRGTKVTGNKTEFTVWWANGNSSNPPNTSLFICG